MNASETIRPVHLSRLAIVYVRQSTPHQMLNNQESLKLQYGLQQRAVSAGWDPQRIRVIDTDLGQTGQTTEGRLGFQEIVALVNQEQVGIIFAYDATRLARNCTDWYQLLDLCAFRGCLVGDQDGSYDPATTNGRLILGLKGLISEMELHTLRARLTAGLLAKALRGELAIRLPIGLVRDELKRVFKHPNQEVRERLELVFMTFQKVKTAGRLLRFLNDHQLRLPRPNRRGDLVWRKPSTYAILSILGNPAYAGAFAYGRTRTLPRIASQRRRVQKSVPMNEWKVCLHDKYPAYIDWNTFIKIQTMLHDNHSEYDRKQSRGAPRAGKALLQGLVYCGECGHKLGVQYKHGVRYRCTFAHKQYQEPVCQNLPAAPLDTHVVAAFFDALAPVKLDLYHQAVNALQQDDDQVQRAQQQQLERLRYQARLAERQFDQADPDNRLVTAELERRWDTALRELKEAEETLQRQQQQPRLAEALSPTEQQAFLQAGEQIPELWRQGGLTAPQQKAFLRCLVDKVVVQRSAPDTVQVRIVWAGGDTTSARVPVGVASMARVSGAKEMEKKLLKLAKQGKTDEEIAALLTQQGYRSPRHTNLLPSTVRIVRLRHRVLRQRAQSHPRRIPGFLTVAQLARQLKIPRHWIYDRIHSGVIKIAQDSSTGLFLFPDKPQTITLFQQLRAAQLNKLRF